MKRHIDQMLQSLVLVRIGQELGTDGPTARAVHDLVSFLIASMQIFG